MAGEFRYYYYALLVGVIGSAMIGAFIAFPSMYMMMAAGCGIGVSVVGVLLLLFAMYKEYRETDSIAEAMGF